MENCTFWECGIWLLLLLHTSDVHSENEPTSMCQKMCARCGRPNFVHCVGWRKWQEPKQFSTPKKNQVKTQCILHIWFARTARPPYTSGRLRRAKGEKGRRKDNRKDSENKSRLQLLARCSGGTATVTARWWPLNNTKNENILGTVLVLVVKFVCLCVCDYHCMVMVCLVSSWLYSRCIVSIIVLSRTGASEHARARAICRFDVSKTWLHESWFCTFSRSSNDVI